LLHRETKTQTSDATPEDKPAVTALRIRHDLAEAVNAAVGDIWRGSTLVFTNAYGSPFPPVDVGLGLGAVPEFDAG
jgi:hypothetical protein